MKNRLIYFSALLALPAALLVFTSCSSNPPDSTRAAVMLDTVSGTATVQSINASDRTVVLQHEDGSKTTYQCGPDIRNFDQIKVGDKVTATVAESVALMLVKGGGVPTGVGATTAMVRAPVGNKPGGKIVDSVGFIARVVSVDADHRLVTLQTADGNQTVKVGPDINLANVKAGDDVGVRVTRAIAIAVTTGT